VAVGAGGGFLILFSYLLTLWQVYPSPAARSALDWSKPLLDRIPGWRRDDVVIAAPAVKSRVKSDGYAVVAIPQGLLVLDTAWQLGELGLVAAAARRVRRVMSQPPNAIDVPVYAAVLVREPPAGMATGWDEGSGVYVLDAHRAWEWARELAGPAAATSSDNLMGRPSVDEALRKVRGWAVQHVRRIALRRLLVLLLVELCYGLAERRRLFPSRTVSPVSPVSTEGQLVRA
jgi:hypothetical protein